jgi:hypothetical protein
MEIKITAIGDKGDINNERIGFEVLKECDLKHFLLFKTDMLDTGFFHKSQDAYWFMPLLVKPNDKIVVYSRKGETSTKANPDGSTTYFFYWGLVNPIFLNANSGVVLAEVTTWQLSKNF